MIRQRPLIGVRAGLRSAVDGAHELAFASSMPNSVRQMNRWSVLSPWTVLHNFRNATLGPLACASASGSTSLPLILIPGGNTSSAKTSGWQSGFRGQSGISATNQSFLFAYASAAWKHSATVPTAYLVTMRFDANPTAGDTFYSGIDGGSNSGWWLESHPTSGVRAAIGVGSGYTYTSYVGGASLFDGRYHTLMLIIDDAAGKAKLYSEYANTESTGLSIAAGGNTICTIGPLARGYAFNGATYLLSSRGEHASLYSEGQAVFDKFEGARIRGGS